MKYILLIISILISYNGYSQDIPKTTPNYFFSISPQYVAVNGFRVDFERRFKESSHGMVISPTYYLGTIGYNHLLSDGSNQEYELNGIGLEYQHKIYADKSWNKNVNWYQAYSLIYNHFNFAYSGFDWVPFNGDPTILSLGEKDQTLAINQFGLTTVIGAVVVIDKNFYADVYFGIGAKRSLANDSSTGNFAEDEFEFGFINYNYTGVLLKTGLKIGFSF